MRNSAYRIALMLLWGFVLTAQAEDTALLKRAFDEEAGLKQGHVMLRVEWKGAQGISPSLRDREIGQAGFLDCVWQRPLMFRIKVLDASQVLKRELICDGSILDAGNGTLWDAGILGHYFAEPSWRYADELTDLLWPFDTLKGHVYPLTGWVVTDYERVIDMYGVKFEPGNVDGTYSYTMRYKSKYFDESPGNAYEFSFRWRFVCNKLTECSSGELRGKPETGYGTSYEWDGKAVPRAIPASCKTGTPAQSSFTSTVMPGTASVNGAGDLACFQIDEAKKRGSIRYFDEKDIIKEKPGVMESISEMVKGIGTYFHTLYH